MATTLIRTVRGGRKAGRPLLMSTAGYGEFRALAADAEEDARRIESAYRAKGVRAAWDESEWNKREETPRLRVRFGRRVWTWTIETAA